jgi:hypothetical protein
MTAPYKSSAAFLILEEVVKGKKIIAPVLS